MALGALLKRLARSANGRVIPVDRLDSSPILFIKASSKILDQGAIYFFTFFCLKKKSVVQLC